MYSLLTVNLIMPFVMVSVGHVFIPCLNRKRTLKSS